MLLILLLVFLAVFIIAVLLLAATRTGATQEGERTLATLQAALATANLRPTDQAVDIRRRDLLSSVPLLNRWLMKMEFAPRVRILIAQADLKWTTGSLLLMSILAFAIPAYLIDLATGSVFFALLLGVMLGAAPSVYVLQRRSNRFRKFEQGFPHTLDLMVSALRAGHSLISAIDLAAKESPDPIGSEFRICFDEHNYGLELKTAMTNLTARIPLQDLKIIVTAILIQKESGGNLAEIFDKAAYVIRERFRLRQQVQVHTAQGRLTGWILSLLPLVVGILLYMINPRSMRVLWTNPVGLKLLYLAVMMTISGALIIRKIVRMDV